MVESVVYEIRFGNKLIMMKKGHAYLLEKNET